MFYRNPEYALKDDSQKSSQKMIEIISQNSNIKIEELANDIGISQGAVKKNIQKLKEKGILKRIGSDRSGYWKVKGLKES